MKTGFTTLDHGASDMVIAISFNSSGTRLALGSVDHKIRVFDQDESETWVLTDAWTGHDAEVLDIKWVGSSLGQIFGTIGGDNKFKLWQENPSQATMHGRRFKCIFSQSPSRPVGYVSLDFKTLRHELWLLLITREGYLSLLEPSDPDTLAMWREIDWGYPVGQQPRGQETNFKVTFHQAETPGYNAIAAGIDPKALSFAVAAFNGVKIYRAVRPDEGSYRFQHVADLNCESALVRDLSWSPDSFRSCDWIAAACDDDRVRVFEVTTPHTVDFSSSSSKSPPRKVIVPGPARPNPPSGIGAGLANVSREVAGTQGFDRAGYVQHDTKRIALLEHHDVWRVEWVYNGNALASTGDEGSVRLWRKGIDDAFIEFADVGPEY